MTDDDVSYELTIKVVGPITTGKLTDVKLLQEYCKANYNASRKLSSKSGSIERKSSN